ncbi:MAG: hypothetical protein K0R12_329 [Gammaproteobacteria bacterium]|jgi:hypothetical protein|nr:hypothetical protein [Gammaproteobacteria bacterium]
MMYEASIIRGKECVSSRVGEETLLRAWICVQLESLHDEAFGELHSLQNEDEKTRIYANPHFD